MSKETYIEKEILKVLERDEDEVSVNKISEKERTDWCESRYGAMFYAGFESALFNLNNQFSGTEGGYYEFYDVEAIVIMIDVGQRTGVKIKYCMIDWIEDIMELSPLVCGKFLD